MVVRNSTASWISPLDLLSTPWGMPNGSGIPAPPAPLSAPLSFGGDSFGTGTSDLPSGTRDALSKFIAAHQDQFDGPVDTPEELRTLLQLLHQGEGQTQPAATSSPKSGAASLEDMSASDMIQMLIDYLANYAQRDQARGAPRGRSLGNLSGGGGASGGGGGGGGGGGTAPASSTSSASGPASVPASTGGTNGNLERWRPMIRESAAKHGIPANEIPAFENYVLAMMKVESGGDPNAIGDNGHSVGLFQMHDRGAGAGMSVEQRKNPQVQLDTMMPKFVAAYRSGQARGLNGAQLAIHIAREAERPVASALPKYGVAYDSIA